MADAPPEPTPRLSSVSASSGPGRDPQPRGLAGLPRLPALAGGRSAQGRARRAAPVRGGALVGPERRARVGAGLAARTAQARRPRAPGCGRRPEPRHTPRPVAGGGAGGAGAGDRGPAPTGGQSRVSPWPYQGSAQPSLVNAMAKARLRTGSFDNTLSCAPTVTRARARNGWPWRRPLRRNGGAPDNDGHTASQQSVCAA